MHLRRAAVRARATPRQRAARQVAAQSSQPQAAETQPSRNIGDHVYGTPTEVRAADRGEAPLVWQNVDGLRVEDGRYKRFVEQLASTGFPRERIYTDALRTHAYGTDASFYRLNPKVVVRAIDEAEVVTILREARACHTPVTFRAAGTSLSGQAITDSVLIKISHNGKHWRRFEVKQGGEEITLEPGLIGGEVNRLLAQYSQKRSLPQRKLGPDPASLESCMIGGIFNNNSSGMCCGVAQNTYHTVKDCRVVLVDGTVLDTADPKSVESFRVSHAPLLSRLSDLAARVQGDDALAGTIRQKFKIKNTTGYSINSLVDFSPSDPVEILKHLLIGSEGTLAFLSEVTYRTVPEHPHRASAFMMFGTIKDACEATKVLKKSGLVNAAELFDRASLREGEASEAFRTNVHGVTGCPRESAGLLTEVRAETAEELQARIDTLWRALEEAGIPFLPTPERNDFVTDPAVFNVFWDMRKGLIPKVGGTRPKGSVMLIEDVACPIDSLADMTLDLIDMFERHSYPDACIFGHALDGNLHLVFSQCFANDADLGQFDAMMHDMCEIVALKHKGSLKGEHGTGRNVASFVELEWGQAAYAAMHEIKDIFDPEKLLNPGVLLTSDPNLHIKSLKPLPLVSDTVDRCIECGFCESNCPSKDLTLTPRQRITAYREVRRLENAAGGGPAEAGYNAARLQDMQRLLPYYVEQTCAADGMCQEKCPVSINTGQMVKELRAEKLQDSPLSLSLAKNFRLTALATRGLLRAASLVRSTLGDGFISAVLGGLKRANVLKLKNMIPVWHRFMPRASSVNLSPSAGAGGNTVVLMPSCVNRMMSPSSGPNALDTLVTILERAGYTVRLPESSSSLCCGMMFDSRGCSSAASLKSSEAVEALRRASDNFKLPIVCETSPCTKALDEAGAIVYDPVSFVHLASKKLNFRQVEDTVVVHVPCSSKKLGTTPAFLSLAKRCAKDVVESGVPCCGAAGDRGMRYPELPGASLEHLPSEARAAGVPCYSTSLTCEVGLSAATDKQWGSLLTLIESATAKRA